jgi:hypothetical protein
LVQACRSQRDRRVADNERVVVKGGAELLTPPIQDGQDR